MTTFDVSVANVPIINLRWEFREFYARAHSLNFLRQPDAKWHPLKTRYFIWVGMPEAGATMMLSRAISGMEAYTSFACEYKGAAAGQFSASFRAACRNPFLLRGGAAEAFYNRLPAMIDENLALKHADPMLWTRVRDFYKEVRNPIFHGHELRGLTDARFAALFDHLAAMYDWIDSWYDMEAVLKGARQTFAGGRPGAAT